MASGSGDGLSVVVCVCLVRVEEEKPGLRGWLQKWCGAQGGPATPVNKAMALRDSDATPNLTPIPAPSLQPLKPRGQPASTR